MNTTESQDCGEISEPDSLQNMKLQDNEAPRCAKEFRNTNSLLLRISKRTVLYVLITLNLGTNLANSWCQLLRVDAGEIIKKGPQMFSLCNIHIKKKINRHHKLIWGKEHGNSFIQFCNC